MQASTLDLLQAVRKSVQYLIIPVSQRRWLLGKNFTAYRQRRVPHKVTPPQPLQVVIFPLLESSSNTGPIQGVSVREDLQLFHISENGLNIWTGGLTRLRMEKQNLAHHIRRLCVHFQHSDSHYLFASVDTHHTRTHTDTHGHTRAHIDTRRHTQTHADTHKHTDTQSNADTQISRLKRSNESSCAETLETHTDIRRHTQTHEDTHEHTQINRDTQTPTDKRRHAHTGTHRHTRRHADTKTPTDTRRHTGTHRHTGIRRHTQHTQTHDAHRHTDIHRHTQKYADTNRHTHTNIDAHGHTQTHRYPDLKRLNEFSCPLEFP
uniref:T-cell receptor beta chain ana 11 n=1 Tax=Ascaris lumbricoides TaxID=6252 RepID=A0A0M3HNC2_ASCLU